MAMRMMNSLQLPPLASLPVMAPLKKKRRALSHGQSFWRSRVRMPAAPESANLFTVQMSSYGDGNMHASSSGHGGRRRGNFSNSNAKCNFLPRAQVRTSAQNPSYAQEEVWLVLSCYECILGVFLIHNSSFSYFLQLITSRKTKGIATHWT